MQRRNSSFLLLWSMAVAASVAAFCVLLTLRVRAIEMGYELGRVHGQLGRLREVRRVLELEVASYQTPERVDLVARTLLGMAPPGSDRMLRGRPLPKVLDAERQAVRGLDEARASGGPGIR
jgi:cell division protein FtsL